MTPIEIGREAVFHLDLAFKKEWLMDRNNAQIGNLMAYLQGF